MTCHTCKHTHRSAHTPMHSHIQTYMHMRADNLVTENASVSDCCTKHVVQRLYKSKRKTLQHHTSANAQVCTHTHAGTLAHMPIRPRAWAYARAHTHTYTETCTHTHAHAHQRTYICPWHIHMHPSIHAPTHAHARKHAAAYIPDATVSNCCTTHVV